MLSFCWAMIACEAETLPHTQLVVVIDSDLTVPDDFDGIRVLARWATDSEKVEEDQTQQFYLKGDNCDQDDSYHCLPVSMGIEPGGGDISNHVIITVEGRISTMPGRTKVIARAKTQFIENKSLILPVYLSERCSNQYWMVGGCEVHMNETCAVRNDAVSCYDMTVDETSLDEMPPVKGDELKGMPFSM